MSNQREAISFTRDGELVVQGNPSEEEVDRWLTTMLGHKDEFKGVAMNLLKLRRVIRDLTCERDSLLAENQDLRRMLGF